MILRKKRKRTRERARMARERPKKKARKVLVKQEIINGRVIRKRIRKRRALPGHVFRDIQAYKHIKKCKSCGRKFEDKYKARLYCDRCRK